ncbi:hypothetical protein SZN_21891 [Streptomyces zinciresistens K42]|uniref:Uncharacterized protein n=1 Tax=Streptomyces zinciresistens K42 TaxID=700597 RepID=G2GFU4_9ACTN|nr:hypothetical protein [Streptomyces zinciresistens]EGX57622.1 hypothetical protein SZN_21891 [Streptomyces zinciresistens K42]
MTTTHRSAKPLAGPGRPVERAVTAALVVATLAGIGWLAGMIYTVSGWGL